MRPEDLLLAPELSDAQVQQILRPYGFKDPQAADRNLQLMGEELTTREMLARLVGSILLVAQKSPDPDAALNYFERLLAAIPTKTSFLSFLGESPEALELVILLCGTSPFSSEILIRNPERFYWLLDQLGATWIKSRDRYLQDARKIMERYSTATDRLRALARVKQREMLRIAARDIFRIANVIQTVTELSFLADTVIHLVYEICRQRLVEKHGEPLCEDADGRARPARFTILGMGKLGGNELNYSSDIDLIYCYDGEQGKTCLPPDTPTDGFTRPIPNVEFFTRLAQDLTNELSTFTEEGYFYRVDLRLRPDGSAGPIAASLTACKNYYASWGETFERMALIKARPVGGSQELGEEFCEAFQPFVYRAFMDFAALEEIQEIKGRIETKLGSREKQASHVKLGAGGIREIEFFVQALQLIYGGGNPALRERGTIKALEKLQEHNYLSSREYDALLQAYLFLRDLEHKLQMVQHLQTHELPSSPEELYKCARRMGYEGKTEREVIDKLRRQYKAHVRNVSRIFQDLIGMKRQGTSRGEMREAVLIMNKNLPEAEAFALLKPYGFADLKSAFHHLCLLRDAPSFSHSPSKMRNLLANLAPALLRSLGRCPDPDAGLSAFASFAAAFGDRDCLYTLLNENSDALRRLLLVLSSSQALGEFLSRFPEFFDAVIQEGVEPDKALQDFREELNELLSGKTNFEQGQSALRHYHEKEFFRIGIKDVLGQLRREQVGRQLAALAEACLDAAFQLACRELSVQYGGDFSAWLAEHFAILALGKFGGNDLSYNSDLDLIYFYSTETAEESIQAQKRCVRLVELLDAILSVSQGEGSIYKIDTRLRPEGKKGELVVLLHRYPEYLQARAQAWERLALVRHRFILGGQAMHTGLEQMINGFVYQPELSVETVKELDHIRRRMEVELGKETAENQFHLKAGAGGLIDVEFSTQLLQLKHGQGQPDLREPNTLAALQKLRQQKLVSPDQYKAFTQGYEFLRLLENRLRLNSPYGATTIARTPQVLTKLSRQAGMAPTSDNKGAEKFEKKYLAITAAIRKAYRSIVEQLQ